MWLRLSQCRARSLHWLTKYPIMFAVCEGAAGGGGTSKSSTIHSFCLGEVWQCDSVSLNNSITKVTPPANNNLGPADRGYQPNCHHSVVKWPGDPVGASNKRSVGHLESLGRDFSLTFVVPFHTIEILMRERRRQTESELRKDFYGRFLWRTSWIPMKTN